MQRPRHRLMTRDGRRGRGDAAAQTRIKSGVLCGASARLHVVSHAVLEAAGHVGGALEPVAGLVGEESLAALLDRKLQCEIGGAVASEPVIASQKDDIGWCI
jgi:hypothetical protein